MNLPMAIRTIRWLVWDTFRQSLASRVFWAMLLVSGVAIVFCLGVGVSGDPPRPRPGEVQELLPPQHLQKLPAEQVEGSGVQPIRGEVSLLFGALQVPLGRDRSSAVRHLQLVLAAGVADTAGVLLALIWTAAFLPTFLEPSVATVLLAKPPPRWTLLAGKYLGVLVFVLLQAVVFVGGTWLALAVRTGVWDGRYLLAIPVLLLHFAVFFSFSTLLAVWTRSTVVCVFGSIVFWLVCWGINYGRHAVQAALAHMPGATAGLQALTELGYWIMPKPADMNLILYDTLSAEAYFPKPAALRTVQELGLFSPELALLTAAAFVLAMLALAARQFRQTDY
jgi:ABC-type transport system involved in multi-copper enzyme maturation permease subunit